MNVSKTIATFAMTAIALSAVVSSVPAAFANDSSKAPVKVAQADKKTEAAPAAAKTESKKASKGTKKSKKAAKSETKTETKEAAPAAK